MADKKTLRAFGSSIRNKLARIPDFDVFRREWSGNGSAYLALGRIADTKIELQVWEDATGGHDPATWWYGFYARKQGLILALAALSGSTAPHYSYSQECRPKDGEFGTPVTEGSGQEFYYGVYLRSRPKPNVKTALQAVRFFLKTLEAYADDRATRADAEASKLDGLSEGGRRKVKSHYAIERRTRKYALLVKKAKQYRCEICSFSFREAYGSIGRVYAEAHHRRPLASLARATRVRAKDLICVCSNCHRMIHRLIATSRLDGPRAINKLKFLVASKRSP